MPRLKDRTSLLGRSFTGASPVSLPPPRGRLVFEDDFTALSLRSGGPTQAGYAAGSGTWTPRYNFSDDPRGIADHWNGQFEFIADPAYTWSNRFTPFSVSDSVLRIRAQRTADLGFAEGEIPNRRDPKGADTGVMYPFVSGAITTEHSFRKRHGYFEARVKLPPTGAGVWPAWWIRNTVTSFELKREIDFIEQVGLAGGGTEYLMTTYWDPLGGPKGKSVYQLFPRLPLSEGWHTIGCLWTPEAVAYVLDGHRLHDLDGARPPRDRLHDAPMWLVLNLAIGGEPWPGPADASTPSPSDFLIDWVRVWDIA